MVKKIFRYIMLFLLGLIGLIVIFVAFSVAPVHRDLPQDHPYYQSMLSSIHEQSPVAGRNFSVGSATLNLTPAHPTALAGYSNRIGKKYDVVHDSIDVRAMVITNEKQKVAIVSADLLLIPPTVYERLREELPSIGFSLDNTFLGATHSHNSIGNWGKDAAQIFYGDYEDSIVTFITDKIKSAIVLAAQDVAPAQIEYGKVSVREAVRNRVIRNGPVDPYLRVVRITRKDRKKLLLMSYTAHATCLFSKDIGLSRDYPGELVDTMEAHGYDFAMFMAGSVGSHGCNPPEYGKSCIDWMTKEISGNLEKSDSIFTTLHDSTLFMYRVQLELGDTQMKIAKNWAVRDWLFEAALGEYPVYISALRIGDIVMLSTPCDFSGEFDPEIDSVAAAHKLFPIVTSFNGGYIGYVTPLKYYDENHSETQLMNWYGPGTGEYLLTCLDKMIVAVSGENQK